MFEPTDNEITITNSFENLQIMYEQVSKLIFEMDKQFANSGFQPNLNNSNAICRWRSDLISEFSGWRVGGIARPYYIVEEDEEQVNKQLVINISFDNDKAPVISFGLFTHDEKIVNSNFGIGDHWLLYWPFMSGRDWNLNKENEYFISSKPTTEKASKTYRGLRNNIFSTVRLLSISNAKSLQNLVVDPAIELFKNGNVTIDDINLTHYISSDDYLELFPYR